MLTGLIQQAHKLKFLANEHSTTILTGVGVGGTVATAYLSGRASFRAAELIRNEQDRREDRYMTERNIHPELLPELPLPVTTRDKLKLTWVLYLPPVAAGATTITCIVVANKISSKKIAALAVASGLSERALQEYKDKVVAKLGEKQDQSIRDEIAQDRVTKNPVGNREVILAGTGEVLCYDMSSGRYFQSTVEDIKRAEIKINNELLNHDMHCSLSEFYDEVGLAPTSYSDQVGWNRVMEVKFSTVMSTDNRPCVAIDFQPMPYNGYDKFNYGDR